jgi:hypothetical protein
MTGCGVEIPQADGGIPQVDDVSTVDAARILQFRDGM